MTEAEWLTCADPQVMLEFLKEKTSDRKLRLFACACARRMIPVMDGIDGDRMIRLAEADVDGLADKQEVADAHELAQRYIAAHVDVGEDWSIGEEAGVALQNSLLPFRGWAWGAAWHNATNAKLGRHHGSRENEALGRADFADKASLLRDIIRYPFRPVTLDPAWLTPAVVFVAKVIDEERAFHRLHELADALEKAGCTNGDILEHCRSGGEHVRGCWAVDLILGKE